MSVVRAFIAVDLAEDVRLRLSQVIERLQMNIGSPVVRWVPPENIHLTLKFLGDVSVKNLPLVKDALRQEAAGRKAFAISAGGLGAFPQPNRPRVLWVGVEAPDELFALQRNIEAHMERLGYERDSRPFTAHLTLGRVSRSASSSDVRKVARVLQEHKLGFVGVSQVDEVHLFRSDLRPGGAVYTRLYSVPLEGLS
ncbi:MAG: RNA 2',3'-cyclic phosphodiesterase [Anaerolineae bacterium]|nr:MAG: RNA 2',3'-cyclic phosphodiesterase [Anaerolineae bacterium]